MTSSNDFPSVKEIREFISSSFSNEEFETFCFDYFPEEYARFSRGMAKNEKIMEIIRFCIHQDKLPQLVSILHRERVGVFPKYWEQFTITSTQLTRSFHRDPKQIFLSHTHSDAKFAQNLTIRLQAEGYKVWITPQSILPGEKWAEAINRGLSSSGIFILILTPSAIKSRWVRTETNVAIELEYEGVMRFLPILLEPCKIPALWATYQRLEWKAYDPKNFIRLLSALENEFLPSLAQEVVVASENMSYDQTIVNEDDVDNSHEDLCVLKEVKAMFIGDGNSGKTSLIRRMIWNETPEGLNKTDGIDVYNWHPVTEEKHIAGKNDAIQFNIWDFGGQEIYHATHQFFFTRRSIYILVVDVRQGREFDRIKYWVDLIMSLAGNSDIVLAISKCDVQWSKVEELTIQKNFPTIRKVIYTSSVSGNGVEELTNYLVQLAQNLDHLNELFPCNWLKVKNKIEERTSHYLPYLEYEALCQNNGLLQEDCISLIQVLNDLGVVAYYPQIARLRSFGILNPEWVTQGIFAILNDEEVQSKKGIVNFNQLIRILDPEIYPHYLHSYLLDLMISFELCFPIGSENNYLIPACLSPSVNPYEHLKTFIEPLHFEIEYSIAPSTIFHKFLARMQNSIDLNLCLWNVVQINHADNTAILILDDIRKRICIWISGDRITRRRFLEIIQFHLVENIQSTYQKLKIVPYAIQSATGYEVPYIALINAERRGRKIYYDGILDVEFNVREMLEGVRIPSDKYIVETHSLMCEYFSLDDLENIAFKIGIDSENLPAVTKETFCREMLVAAKRRELVSRMVEICEQLRPEIDW